MRPPPRITLCIGIKSSGSTWLYNVAIRSLRESAKRGALKTFYADNFKMFPPGIEKARELVIKSHEPSDALLFLTRFARGRMFLTVREPRDSVASLMQRFGHSFEGALKDVTLEAERIVALARGHKPMTLRYEDGFTEREATVGRVARHLGVTLSKAAQRRIFRALTPDAVRRKIATLQDKGTFGTNPDEFDPATHWHPRHVGDGRIGKYKSVLTEDQQKRIMAATKEYCREFGYPRPRKR
jgi:hypothetical protein